LKTCCTCKNSKEEINFGKNKNTEDGLSAQCRQCATEYRDSHKQDKVNCPSSNIEYRREYIKNNKDRINKLRKEKYKGNPEKYREQGRKSHQNHREERLKRQRMYYENNKESFVKKNKEYRQSHPDEILLRNRQREKLLNSFPIIKQSEINNLLNEHNHKCFYCGINIKRGINLHLDHKTPLSRGGEHTISNLAPACITCNLRKRTKTAEQFLMKINGGK